MKTENEIVDFLDETIALLSSPDDWEELGYDNFPLPFSDDSIDNVEDNKNYFH